MSSPVPRRRYVDRRSLWLRPLCLGLVIALLLIGASRVGAPWRVPGSEGARPSSAPPQGSEGTAAVTSSLLVCPGPELQGLRAPKVAEAAQRVTLAARSAPLEVLGPDLAAQLEQEAASNPGELLVVPTRATPVAAQRSRGSSVNVTLTGPEGAVVQALGVLAPGLAATQSHLSLQEQTRGLEVTPCVPPAEESWLLAGGDQDGRLERLVLINPGADPVTATVRLLGRDGPSEADDSTDIVVPGGARVVELMDPLAGDRSPTVVHVTTEAGSVAAFLGDRWLDGSADRGLELTTPTAPPATDQLVPAVVRTEQGRAQLRVAVPGPDQAIVQVRALTPDGLVRVQQEVTLVPGGRSQDIEITDLPPGRYALEVTSDVEVVAAGSTQSAAGATGARGLAWSPATRPLQGVAGLALPAPGPRRPEAVLQLVSRRHASAQVVTVDDAGTARSERVEMPGGKTVELALAESTGGVWVRPLTGPVHAAVTFERTDPAGDLLASAALSGQPVLRPVTSVEPSLP